MELSSRPVKLHKTQGDVKVQWPVGPVSLLLLEFTPVILFCSIIPFMAASANVTLSGQSCCSDGGRLCSRSQSVSVLVFKFNLKSDMWAIRLSISPHTSFFLLHASAGCPPLRPCADSHLTTARKRRLTTRDTRVFVAGGCDGSIWLDDLCLVPCFFSI